MKWMMSGRHDGKTMLAIPILGMEKYTYAPLQSRWAFHLVFAMMITACVSVFGPAELAEFLLKQKEYIDALE